MVSKFMSFLWLSSLLWSHSVFCMYPVDEGGNTEAPGGEESHWLGCNRYSTSSTLTAWLVTWPHLTARNTEDSGSTRVPTKKREQHS